MLHLNLIKVWRMSPRLQTLQITIESGHCELTSKACIGQFAFNSIPTKYVQILISWVGGIYNLTTWENAGWISRMSQRYKIINMSTGIFHKWLGNWIELTICEIIFLLPKLIDQTAEFWPNFTVTAGYRFPKVIINPADAFPPSKDKQMNKNRTFCAHPH